MTPLTARCKHLAESAPRQFLGCHVRLDGRLPTRMSSRNRLSLTNKPSLSSARTYSEEQLLVEAWGLR